MKSVQPRRKGIAGSSLVESWVGVGIIFLITASILSITSTALRAVSKNQTQLHLTGSARRSLDEMLQEIRAADQVVQSKTLNGATYTTGATTIVLSAPGYDPGRSDLFLSGVTDYIALQYDPATKTVKETITPGAGSARPARANVVLAKNVAGLTCTFRTRKQFKSLTSGSAVGFTLDTTPLAQPDAYVNGVKTTCVWVPGTAIVAVPVAAANSDVQFQYSINPSAGGGTAASLVGEVEVALQFSRQDDLQIARADQLNGAARLRNWTDASGARQ